jgi:hypothetical protein
MAVTIDGTTGIDKVQDGSIVYADLDSNIPLGTKNLIINGNMAIAQRGTSVAGISSSNDYHTIDRWRTYVSTAGTWTQTQDTDVPSGQGFAESLKMDCTTADGSLGAADRVFLGQRIEGFNVQSLAKGTPNAKSTTFSFWVKSNKTGTYIAELYDSDNTRQVSSSYTVSVADTWEKKTITYAGDTTGVLANDNGVGLLVQFYLAAGSDYTSGTLQTSWAANVNANRAVGQVNLADSTSNYINITGVQLEVGTEATPFENRPYDMELARCQRYYFFQDQVQFIGYQPSGQLFAVMNYFPISMRASPTLTVFDYAGASGKVFLNANNVTGTIDISQKNSCRVYASTTTTGSQTFGYTFKADAEL